MRFLKHLSACRESQFHWRIEAADADDGYNQLLRLFVKIKGRLVQQGHGRIKLFEESIAVLGLPTTISAIAPLSASRHLTVIAVSAVESIARKIRPGTPKRLIRIMRALHRGGSAQPDHHSIPPSRASTAHLPSLARTQQAMSFPLTGSSS